MNLKTAFAYLDNPEKVRQRNFNKLLRRLDKPLFTHEELFGGVD